MPSENKALFYVVSRHKNKIRVTGRPGLKSTEHYPLQFCKAVALIVAANVERAQTVDRHFSHLVACCSCPGVHGCMM